MRLCRMGYKVEMPIGGLGCPWRSSRAEFDFAGARIEPMEVFIDKMAWEIAGKRRTGYKL